MSEPEELRSHLESLRLDRSAKAVGTRRPPWLVPGVVIVALLTVMLTLRSCLRHPVTVEVSQVTVPTHGQSDLPVLSGSGYVVSADRYIAIGVRVAGRIDRYLVEEGDRVHAGDALVQLDPRDYESAVTRAEANLRFARANAELKAKQLKRVQTLHGVGVMSRDELDVRATDAETAAASVGQAEAELQQARVALDYTTLRAPRNGVILAKMKEVGEIAVPGGFSGSGDLIRMANLDDLRGQVDVTESELAKLRLQQRAEVVPDAYPDHHYRAHVVKLYPQVDRQKGTLRVEVQIEQPDDALWPDMSARITFFEPVPQAGAGVAVVLIPRSALRGEQGATYVWTVAEGRVHHTPVSPGPTFGDQIQAMAGLAGGETIVVGDPPALQDGQPVQLAGGR